MPKPLKRTRSRKSLRKLNKLKPPPNLEKILQKRGNLLRVSAPRKTIRKCPTDVHKFIKDWIKDKSKNLEYLDLTYCPYMNDKVLRLLLSEFPKVKTLDLTSCDCFTSGGFAIGKNGTKVDNIETLILENCPEIGEPEFITPIQIKMLLKYKFSSNTIVSRILGFIESHVHYIELVEILKRVPNLKNLSLKWCHWISPCTLKQVFKTAAEKTKLEILSLAHCSRAATENVLIYGSTKCKFKGLSLGWCRGVTDKALQAVCHPKLQILELTACTQLSPNGIVNAVTQLMNLKTLDLSCCYQITDDVIITLAKHSRRLEYLDVSCDDKLTSAALNSLGECDSLKHLNLSTCTRITDFSALKKFKKLINFNVLGNPQFSDENIKDIIDNSKRIKKLNMSKCEKVTDKGIDYIAEKCKSLQEINVSGCPAITNGSVLWLVRKCKSLRIIVLSEMLGNDPKTQISGLTISQMKMLNKNLSVQTVINR